VSRAGLKIRVLCGIILSMNIQPIIAIHGGVLFEKNEHDKSIESEIRAALKRSLKVGRNALQHGTSVDAVEQAVMALEDSGLFDAGRGSVYTSDGTQELDAVIIDGKTRNAGAVTCVSRIKNPVSGARIVLEKTPHVILSGSGAERAVKESGGEIVDPSYFYCEPQYQYYLNAKKRGEKYKYHSTVGAVAIDSDGSMAAATSTGGLEMQYPGRIGDSSIIGAGTYAENDIAAISCTGSGEIFLRLCAAYDIAARMKYGKEDALSAIRNVLDQVKDLGGKGGVIAIDASGIPHFMFNGAGMYRGVHSGDSIDINIF